MYRLYRWSVCTEHPPYGRTYQTQISHCSPIATSESGTDAGRTRSKWTATVPPDASWWIDRFIHNYSLHASLPLGQMLCQHLDALLSIFPPFLRDHVNLHHHCYRKLFWCTRLLREIIIYLEKRYCCGKFSFIRVNTHAVTEIHGLSRESR